MIQFHFCTEGSKFFVMCVYVRVFDVFKWGKVSKETMPLIQQAVEDGESRSEVFSFTVASTSSLPLCALVFITSTSPFDWLHLS